MASVKLPVVVETETDEGKRGRGEVQKPQLRLKSGHVYSTG